MARAFVDSESKVLAADGGRYKRQGTQPKVRASHTIRNYSSYFMAKAFGLPAGGTAMRRQIPRFAWPAAGRLG